MYRDPNAHRSLAFRVSNHFLTHPQQNQICPQYRSAGPGWYTGFIWFNTLFFCYQCQFKVLRLRSRIPVWDATR
jgi:hypothetical protein